MEEGNAADIIAKFGLNYFVDEIFPKHEGPPKTKLRQKLDKLVAEGAVRMIEVTPEEWRDYSRDKPADMQMARKRLENMCYKVYQDLGKKPDFKVALTVSGTVAIILGKSSVL